VSAAGEARGLREGLRRTSDRQCIGSAAIHHIQYALIAALSLRISIKEIEHRRVPDATEARNSRPRGCDAAERPQIEV
jgi:hypothetical protein